MCTVIQYTPALDVARELAALWIVLVVLLAVLDDPGDVRGAQALVVRLELRDVDAVGPGVILLPLTVARIGESAVYHHAGDLDAPHHLDTVGSSTESLASRSRSSAPPDPHSTLSIHTITTRVPRSESMSSAPECYSGLEFPPPSCSTPLYNASKSLQPVCAPSESPQCVPRTAQRVFDRAQRCHHFLINIHASRESRDATAATYAPRCVAPEFFIAFLDFPWTAQHASESRVDASRSLVQVCTLHSATQPSRRLTLSWYSRHVPDASQALQASGPATAATRICTPPLCFINFALRHAINTPPAFKFWISRSREVVFALPALTHTHVNFGFGLPASAVAVASTRRVARCSREQVRAKLAFTLPPSGQQRAVNTLDLQFPQVTVHFALPPAAIVAVLVQLAHSCDLPGQSALTAQALTTTAALCLRRKGVQPHLVCTRCGVHKFAAALDRERSPSRWRIGKARLGEWGSRHAARVPHLELGYLNGAQLVLHPAFQLMLPTSSPMFSPTPPIAAHSTRMPHIRTRLRTRGRGACAASGSRVSRITRGFHEHPPRCHDGSGRFPSSGSRSRRARATAASIMRVLSASQPERCARGGWMHAAQVPQRARHLLRVGVRMRRVELRWRCAAQRRRRPPSPRGSHRAAIPIRTCTTYLLLLVHVCAATPAPNAGFFFFIK
ncbi:hypothetical protein DFH09DRAFT_1455686 [Mycena vulgaris]|nr:hypothetical protein DFH09DRAFT_1455686 [Mycena vulgaris]